MSDIVFSIHVSSFTAKRNHVLELNKKNIRPFFLINLTYLYIDVYYLKLMGNFQNYIFTISFNISFFESSPEKYYKKWNYSVSTVI